MYVRLLVTDLFVSVLMKDAGQPRTY